MGGKGENGREAEKTEKKRRRGIGIKGGKGICGGW
jgi:hypothetical protein